MKKQCKRTIEKNRKFAYFECGAIVLQLATKGSELAMNSRLWKLELASDNCTFYIVENKLLRNISNMRYYLILNAVNFINNLCGVLIK